jgi:hypothetical protein
MRGAVPQLPIRFHTAALDSALDNFTFGTSGYIIKGFFSSLKCTVSVPNICLRTRAYLLLLPIARTEFHTSEMTRGQPLTNITFSAQFGITDFLGFVHCLVSHSVLEMGCFRAQVNMWTGIYSADSVIKLCPQSGPVIEYN